jgi:hypothetical protein
MKISIKLLTIGLSTYISLQMMSSCSDSKETTTGTQTKETKSASSSMFGKSTEEKVDDFSPIMLAI